jgi:hypothetical protein
MRRLAKEGCAILVISSELPRSWHQRSVESCVGRLVQTIMTVPVNKRTYEIR